MTKITEVKNYKIMLGETNQLLDHYLKNKSYSKIILITDHHVKKLYADTLQHQCILISIKAGEHSKNFSTLDKVLQTMLKHQCDKSSLIIALGGGVVGDISGLVAAGFMRGIDYVQIPTTLLAMIDSSIGGKNAINLPQGKNLFGTIYPPAHVIINPDYLSSLSKKHLINGLMEAIKIFLTHDEKSFAYASKKLNNIIDGDKKALTTIIKRAILLKARVILKDEYEKNERKLLNFGHTIGHALEKMSGFKMLHGYAVGYGILFEARLSMTLGLLSTNDFLRIEDFFKRLDIRIDYFKSINIKKLILATKSDKKNVHGASHYVLLKKIGEAYVSRGKYSHGVQDEFVMPPRSTLVILSAAKDLPWKVIEDSSLRSE